MTYGERAARVALAELARGVVETPPGSNTSPRIREYQAATTLGGTGWPWCSAFVVWCWKSATVPLGPIPATASTWALAEAARSTGNVLARPKVGAAWCIPGVHVEMIVEIVSLSAAPGGVGSVVRTVGGNVDNGVRSRIRRVGDRGSIVLAPPAIRLEKDAPVPRRYYIERVDAPARRLVGPWRSKAARGRALSRLPARERDRARLVRKGGKFYAELGQARILGPWADPDSRARAARALTARGERVRSFSRPAVRTGSAAVDELGQTT
jgi:hypothetical protein